MIIFKSNKNKIFFLLVLTALIFIIYARYGTPWERTKYANEFESYLKEKYNTDFEVENLSFDFFHNTYHAMAYEEGRPNFKFYVGQMHNSEITDAYVFEKNQNLAVDTITSILDRHLPNRLRTTIDIVGINNEVEVNITTSKEVSTEKKEEIKTMIANQGFLTNQVYFHVAKE